MSVTRIARSRGALLLSGALALLSCLALAGCGGKQKARPGEVYVASTLQELGRSAAPGPGLFEIDAPEFDFVKGNTAVVRDGNARVFFTGPDLEKNVESWKGKKLGVKRMTEPGPHLRIQKVGKSYLDTTFAQVVPHVIRLTPDQTQTPGAPLPEMEWSKIEEARNYLPKNPGDPPINVQTLIIRFVRAPRPDNPQQEGWYAVFSKATLELVDLSPGAGWVLDLLNAKHQSLQGSFTVVSLVDNAPMAPQLGHVCGKLRVNWIRYGGTFIKGTPD